MQLGNLRQRLLKNRNMSFELKPYLSQKQELVNQSLNNILNKNDRGRELIQAMTHSLMAGGKRLRPILCMAAAEVCGSAPQIALPAACALEMIHTYSLIHDDLPAMDDDDLRRGQPTCHKRFCEATAILAGDGLLTHAFHIMSQPHLYFHEYPGPTSLIELIARISDAAGINGMVEGQMMDMQAFKNRRLDKLSHLKKIHELKTGRMISASVEAGAISAGAETQAIDKLNIYAKNIGLAFQVVDDILNIEGDPDIMGKAAGSDALNDKMTYPAIIGLSESKTFAKDLVEQALDAIRVFDKEKAAPLSAIARYIINRDH